jgi:hypothetical protein
MMALFKLDHSQFRPELHMARTPPEATPGAISLNDFSPEEWRVVRMAVEDAVISGAPPAGVSSLANCCRRLAPAARKAARP